MTEVPVRAANDIDDVVEVLDDVVEWAMHEASAFGYFAALYRNVTIKVREGVEDGFFDDGPRMARLDTVFANRYLAALAARVRQDDPTAAWQVTFDAVEEGNSIVLQHLLVGINAHINLDLGVAAVMTAPGDALPGLRRDFDRINVVLASMVAHSKQQLADISPWLGLLDAVGGSTDDQLVRFSIEVARWDAWRFASRLAGLADDGRAQAIAGRDEQVREIGAGVLRPGWLRVPLWLIRLRESDDVRRNMRVLAAMPGPGLAEVEQVVAGRREAFET